MVRDELERREKRQLHYEQIEKQNLLKSSVDELRKPAGGRSEGVGAPVNFTRISAGICQLHNPETKVC